MFKKQIISSFSVYILKQSVSLPLHPFAVYNQQVTRQVAQCKCAKRFQVEQIGENKYRVRKRTQPFVEVVFS